MKRVLCVLLYGTLVTIGSADTIHLKNRGSEINGRVTYSNGVFQVVAMFGRGPRPISVGRGEVDEVRFNRAENNPDLDAPDWMKNLPRDSPPQQGPDVVRFWKEDKAELSGVLETITTEDIKIRDRETFKKADVRAVLLH
jgi:hypothetical protein